MPLALDRVPDIDFAVKDPALIQAEVLRDYELRFLALTQIAKTLAPGDPTRLVLLVGAHWLVHDRVDIDFTGKHNLLKYARGPFLDNIAALYGERTLRLEEAHATTTLRFTLTQELPFTALVPLGTGATSNGDIVFRTIESGVIAPGEMSVEVRALSVGRGHEYNGFAPGQISTLVDWNQTFAVTVVNTLETTGGSGIEDDEHYRERIWLAPESFSTCGPVGAYEFWAKSAHPEIIDVAVHSAPEIAGEVHLYPLMRNGELPTQEILDLVYAECSAEKRRPLTDYVFAEFPLVHEFELELTYWLWLHDQTLAALIGENVRRAVDSWLLWTRSRVGRDIIPTQLIRLIQEAGVKRVAVRRPAPGEQELTIPSPPYTPLAYNEVAIIKGVPVINFGGFEDE